MCRFGEPIELGAQWIHGGCRGNPVFDLAVAHRLVENAEGDRSKTKRKEEGIQARVETENTENMYSSSGKMISREASAAAADIYGVIIDGAQNYFEGSYKTDRSRYSNSPSNFGAPITILKNCTFYSRRDLLEYFQSKATDAVKMKQEEGMGPLFIRELQSALNAYCNGLAVYAGNDLNK